MHFSILPLINTGQTSLQTTTLEINYGQLIFTNIQGDTQTVINRGKLELSLTVMEWQKMADMQRIMTRV